MPWYNGDYPPSYKNQPPKLREKAVEIANEILKESGDEGIAIATGLKKRGNILRNIRKKQMQTTNYFLLDDQERHVIVHGETGLRVHVFGLEADNYRPTPGELHIFGEDHGEWLAFETEGWSMEGMDIITGAVVWYARYLDYPEMQLTRDDPRSAFKLKKV
jgi:hypothetical protein